MSHYKPYPAYKDSGVEWIGPLPKHWDTIPLGKVSTERCDGPFGSGLKSEHYATAGVRVVRLQNIGSGFFRDDDAAFIDADYWRDELGGGHDVLPGDLLVAGLGDENNPLGRACVAPASIGPALVKADCYRFRLVPKANPEFVALALSATARGECGYLATGATRDRLNLSLASARKVPIPPPSEQGEIVNAIGRETARIDALIAKKTRFIELLKEKRQALITHAVTKGLDPHVRMKDSGVEWIGEVPAHWAVSRLKRMVKLGTSISYGIVQPGEPQSDGVPFVQTTNMTNGKFDLDDLQRTTTEIAFAYPRSKLEGGEVLLGIRASIGAAVVAPGHLKGANLSRGVARIECGDGIRSAFLVHWFASGTCKNYWELAKQGSTFNEVSIETVREMSLVVPPASEQEAISEHLHSILARLELLITKVDDSITLLKERRAALISAAVTGQIDLRSSAASEP